MEESVQERCQDVGKHSLRLVLQVAFLCRGEKAARSCGGMSGAHPPLGAHYVPGLMPRLWARESQPNCWMHDDLFGLGNAEHMAENRENAGLCGSCR